MPSFKLRGFPTGALVALTIAQGAASVSGQVTFGQPTTGGGSGTPNATFSIALIDGCTDIVAPYGCFLRAVDFSGFKKRDGSDLVEPAGDTNVYDVTQHQITFKYFFGDEVYVPVLNPNLPNLWRNLNVATGREVSHVWHTPGPRFVYCYAFDELGNWGSASYVFGQGGQSPEIADPNTFAAFAGANTILWSQNNDFTADPTGGTATRCTTIAQVHDALRARMNAGNRNLRVLQRAGETFTDNWFFSLGDGVSSGPSFGYPSSLGASGAVSFNYRDGIKGIHFGKFGPGARPAIRYTANQTKPPIGFPDRTDCRQLVLSDLDFGAGWDAASETGRAGWSGDLGGARGFILLTRCKWDGFDTGLGDRQQLERGLIYHDSVITNWANYGTYIDTARYALLGCDIFQKVGALAGTDQDRASQNPWTLGNRHGPHRSGIRNYETVLSCNYFGSWNGWSNNDGNWITQPPTATQPCLRHHSHFADVGINLRRHYHVMERCAFEGGSLQVGVSSLVSISKVNTNGKNTLIDTCLLVGTTFQGGAMLQIYESGVTVRNTMIYRHALPRRYAQEVGSEIFVMFSAQTTDADWGPVEIYNNTLLSNQPLNELSTFVSDFFLAVPYRPIHLSKNAERVSASVNPARPLVMENIPIPANYLRETNNIVRIVNATTSSPGVFNNPQFLPLSTDPIAGFVCKFSGVRWNFRTLNASSVTAQREQPGSPGVLQPGNVAPGEWIAIPWPNSNPAENNGYAPNGAAAFRAAVIANSTQRHVASLSNYDPKRMSDSALWPGSGGGLTFDFSNATYCRVRNDTTTTWTAGDIRIRFDLKDILMPPIAESASPADVPLANPLAGSAAILPQRPAGAPWPLTGFLTDYRLGSRTPPNGEIQTFGSHKMGAAA